MGILATKIQVLEDAGYAYSFDRSIYLNRNARKVFSLEFVEDHSEAELEARINRPAPSTGEWQFHFNSDPSDAVKRDLLKILS